jgi:hypothetical protein
MPWKRDKLNFTGHIPLPRGEYDFSWTSLSPAATSLLRLIKSDRSRRRLENIENWHSSHSTNLAF